MSDITTEAAAGGELEAELADARQRLHDVDHRIKNDLQLIASVFVLHLRRLPPGPERDTMRAALERLNAVMAVHRRFDAAGDPTRMPVDDVIRDVVEEAAAASGRADIRVRLEIDAVSLPSRQAAPLALIAGELVRNALRHPFPDRAGEIAVRLGVVRGAVELCVEDNGVGLADADAARGFGTSLVVLLAQQLRGQFEIVAANPGVRAVVRFPGPA